MPVKFALVGNPNTGKTTLFNDLTGSSQHVGNWPGVTVEKKEGKLKGNKEVVIQDLPGIYSLSPYSSEEVITRDYLTKERPDAIINIVDSSNIERNLYLTTQLTELGIPVVIALNMIDVIKKRGDTIDIKRLGEALGCEIIETSAVKGVGSKEVAQAAIKLSQNKTVVTPKHKFSDIVENALSQIEDIIKNMVNVTNVRWYTVKVFERDENVLDKLQLSKADSDKIDSVILACENDLDDNSVRIITGERYSYIADVVKQTVTKKHTSKDKISDKIDRIVTNRVLALPIFAGIMFLVYFISIQTVGGLMTDWVNESLFGEFIPVNLTAFLESINTAPLLMSLILDGIVAGVGAVIGFIPQLLVLFVCLAILEDCGYMARIAFIMDTVFRRFGLSGKSVIPLLITTGCGVPGIMASRTIENDNDRRITVMTTTFIPCSAKLPIIALITGALFANMPWVAPSMYFIGIGAVLVSGIMLKKMKRFSGKPTPFVMELPAYHVPKIYGVLKTTWDRGFAFVKRAGTIILVSTCIVWFLSSFNTSLVMVVDANESILATAGNVIAPMFAPLGWGEWRAVAATVTGLVAKENIVGTFGILYGFAEVTEAGVEIWASLQAAFIPLAGLSFLLFNLLAAPCFAAIGAAHREYGSSKWTLFSVAFQCLFAYAVSLIVFQFGMLFMGGGFTVTTLASFIVLGVLVYLLIRKPYTEKARRKQAYSTMIDGRGGAVR